MKISMKEVQELLRKKIERGEVDDAGEAHVSLAELTGNCETLTERGTIRMHRYQHEDIQLCLDLLNSLTITGVSNAEKVAVIAQKLMNPLPEKEEDHGSDSEGK